MNGTSKGPKRHAEPDDDDDDVPRLPRGRGIHVRGRQLVRIGMLAALLVAIAVFGRPCADGVSDFIVSFSPPPAVPTGPAELGRGEVRRLTDDEIRARFPSLIEADAGAAEPSSDAGPDRESESER